MNATEAQDIRNGYMAGASILALSRQFHRGKPAIRDCLHDLRISSGRIKHIANESEVIELYDTGLSFSQVAVKFNIGREAVRSIMRRCAADKIRGRHDQAQARARPDRVGFDLESMDLYDVGPCIACHTPLVSAVERKQACGFCAIAPGGSRMFQGRAA